LYFGEDYDPLHPNIPLGVPILPPPPEWREGELGSEEQMATSDIVGELR
jgi:hypothetical protein